MTTKDGKYAEIFEKLDRQRAEIEKKERILRSKERQLRTSRLIKIGEAAAKFRIDEFDEETLKGAFSEIQEKAKQPNTIEAWKKIGESMKSSPLSPLIVSFRKEISDELKEALKTRRFRWSPFRKEWQGHGIKEEVENLVKEFDGKVVLFDSEQR